MWHKDLDGIKFEKFVKQNGCPGPSSPCDKVKMPCVHADRWILEIFLLGRWDQIKGNFPVDHIDPSLKPEKWNNMTLEDASADLRGTNTVVLCRDCHELKSSMNRDRQFRWADRQRASKCYVPDDDFKEREALLAAMVPLKNNDDGVCHELIMPPHALRDSEGRDEWQATATWLEKLAQCGPQLRDPIMDNGGFDTGGAIAAMKTNEKEYPVQEEKRKDIKNTAIYLQKSCTGQTPENILAELNSLLWVWRSGRTHSIVLALCEQQPLIFKKYIVKQPVLDSLRIGRGHNDSHQPNNGVLDPQQLDIYRFAVYLWKNNRLFPDVDWLLVMQSLHKLYESRCLQDVLEKIVLVKPGTVLGQECWVVKKSIWKLLFFQQPVVRNQFNFQ